MATTDGTRLNKFIATQLNVGRRAADDIISAGKVLVNGKQPQLGARVFDNDQVIVDGKRLHTTQNYVYLLMNKPVGYICSRRQQGSVQTIYTLLPPEYQHLKTVGRLDKDSSGLILLTNDGDLAHRLTHPSFVKVKKYEVTLDKPLQPLHRQIISDFGIDLPDGKSKLHLDRLSEGNNKQWQVTMHEGRNRQIRRTFAAVGYNVAQLHRTQFGPYTLNQLHSKQLMPISIEK